MFKVLKMDRLPLAESNRLMDFDSVEESRFRRRICVWLGWRGRGRIPRQAVSHLLSTKRVPRNQQSTSQFSADPQIDFRPFRKMHLIEYVLSSPSPKKWSALKRNTENWENPIVFIVLGRLNISPTNSTCSILFR
jgi:hypothetical protein